MIQQRRRKPAMDPMTMPAMAPPERVDVAVVESELAVVARVTVVVAAVMVVVAAWRRPRAGVGGRAGMLDTGRFGWPWWWVGVRIGVGISKITL